MKHTHRSVGIVWSWRAGALHSGWLTEGRYTESTHRFSNLDGPLLSMIQKHIAPSGSWVLAVRTSALEGLVAARIILTSLNVIAWLHNYPVFSIIDAPRLTHQSARRNSAESLARSQQLSFQKQLLASYQRSAV